MRTEIPCNWITNLGCCNKVCMYVCMFRPDYCNSYPPNGLKLLLTSVASKIQASSERSYRKCWNFPRVKAFVSSWSFLTLQGKKRSKITIQNNTYCSRILVAFLDTITADIIQSFTVYIFTRRSAYTHFDFLFCGSAYNYLYIKLFHSGIFFPCLLLCFDPCLLLCFDPKR